MSPTPNLDRLLELAGVLGVSQAELARRVGLETLTQAQISSIERGKVEVDAATWAQIEIALIELRKEKAPCTPCWRSRGATSPLA